MDNGDTSIKLNNISNINNDNRDDNYQSDSSSSDSPPPPDEVGMLVSMNNNTNTNTNTNLGSYISTHSIYSIFSWIGSSLYSLSSIPYLFSYSSNPEYDHEKILSTIRKLNNHLNFLDKKIEKMNENTLRFADKAEALYKKKNIKSAIHQIRLKKMYDNEIQKLDSLKFNIESQILHMDSVEIMMVTVDTIKDTSEYYQNMHSNINITQLENTLDEMVEHQDAATDMQSILSDMNTFKDSAFDEDELLKELQELSSNDDHDINNTNNKESTLKQPVPHSCANITLSDLPEAPTTSLKNNHNYENVEVSF